MYGDKIIDVHSHVYTKGFLRELEKRTEFPMLRSDSAGHRVIHFRQGVSNPVPESFFDIDHRLAQMKLHGVSTQVISGTNPWTDSFPSGELASTFSKLANDDISTIVAESKGRFFGLATLPLLSPDEAARELERAVDELGLCGAIIGTNVAGAYVSEEKFHPIFDVASRKRCLIFLHPTNPLGAESLKENGMSRSIGFAFETTACLVKMAYSGIFDKFPNLKILAAHLAGTLPYLQGRIETAWRNFSDSKGKLNEPPSAKIRKAVYADTISYNPSVIRLASEFFGIEKLLFGTDYPFDWGVKEARESVEATFKKAAELQSIYSDNFQRILTDLNQ